MLYQGCLAVFFFVCDNDGFLLLYIYIIYLVHGVLQRIAHATVGEMARVGWGISVEFGSQIETSSVYFMEVVKVFSYFHFVCFICCRFDWLHFFLSVYKRVVTSLFSCFLFFHMFIIIFYPSLCLCYILIALRVRDKKTVFYIVRLLFLRLKNFCFLL